MKTPKNISIELAEMLDEILSLQRLPNDQKLEFKAKIEEAVSLNLVSRLVDKLTLEKRDSLSQKQFESAQGLVDFFSESLPSEEIETALSEAIEVVLTKFIDRV